jgi:hypothetical protein
MLVTGFGMPSAELHSPALVELFMLGNRPQRLISGTAWFVPRKFPSPESVYSLS